MGKITNLVFEGGGVKGLAYVGAVSELAAQGHLSTVEHIAGASAGAIMAVFLGLGYNLEEIEELLAMDFRTFKDKLPDITLKHYGLHSGKSFAVWMADKIGRKVGNPRATFADLYALVLQQPNKDADFRLRNIHLMGSNLTTRQGEVFSYHTTPNMPLIDAVRISMSFPLFFAAKRYAKNSQGEFLMHNGELVESKKGDLYVDGGLAMNYPVRLFDNGYPNPETLGFRVDTPAEIDFLRDGDSPKQELIDGWLNYGSALISTAMWAQHQATIDNLRTVYINTGKIGTLQFNLNNDQKTFLLDEGRKATRRFFNQNYQTLSPHRVGDQQLLDALRLQKLNLRTVLSKASSLYFHDNQPILHCGFNKKPNETWQDLQARAEKYYQWCQKFVGARSLQLYKQTGGELMVITLTLNETLHAEVKHATNKLQASIATAIRSRPFDVNQDKLILLRERAETLRPAWMTNPMVSSEQRRNLWQAVSVGNVPAVVQFIQAGVPLDDKDDKGNGLLHLAASYGHTALLVLLRERGRLSPNAINHYGDTPLHKAADRTALANDTEGQTVLALLQAGANANARAINDKTPLMVAADFGHTEAIRHLLQHGADIDEQKEGGLTALMLAVRGNHTAAVELLLEHSADVTLTDKQGKITSDYAQQASPQIQALFEAIRPRRAIRN